MLDMEKKLIEYTKGKKVLDIGSTGEIHEIVNSNAKECLGLTISQKGVEIYKKKGHNVILADCQNYEMPEEYGQFDVIFAGELIEHLPNPGLFIENCRKWLKDDGVLILTTPNARSIFKFTGDFIGKWNEGWQHILAHNRSTIKHLLEFYDFKTERIDFFVYRGYRRNILNKIAYYVCIPLFILRPTLAHQMFIVAKKSKNLKKEYE